ncbi:MAG TPA: ribosome silencing factor [Bacteroidales bacterium]|jgi:ribosome-associated protein|nr:MAG: Ribosomal silencing factor RsfS [Bacteroidetes bacterium ADurb.Bin416]HBL73114.1 ribosome silencing factor [Bacteroidales bacterium]
MTETETLVNRIKEGLQEKKGRRIVIVDMTALEAVCSYFVICEGTSNTHINAVTDAALEYVRTTTGLKPLAVDGLSNATWVAVDYGDVMVHVFDQASRQYYNLEHLWSDAKLTVVPDLV